MTVAMPAFLILALAVIHYQVAIYDLVDVYYDEDGTVFNKGKGVVIEKL